MDPPPAPSTPQSINQSIPEAVLAHFCFFFLVLLHASSLARRSLLFFFAPRDSHLLRNRISLPPARRGEGMLFLPPSLPPARPHSTTAPVDPSIPPLVNLIRSHASMWGRAVRFRAESSHATGSLTPPPLPMTLASPADTLGRPQGPPPHMHPPSPPRLACPHIHSQTPDTDDPIPTPPFPHCLTQQTGTRANERKGRTTGGGGK